MLLPIDKQARNYLQGLMETLPKAMNVVEVGGDGNCLVHAISRTLVQTEVLYAALRKDLQEILAFKLSFYVSMIFPLMYRILTLTCLQS